MEKRIDPAAIEEIKRRTDLVDYIGRRVKLQRKGKAYFGLCPFHRDSKPSFVVDPDKQLWNCLGACAAGGGGKSGGDIISFVMKEEGCSFREAVGKLQPEKTLTVHPEVRRKGPALLWTCDRSLPESYLESRSAQEYVAGRGIDPHMAGQYRAGYADGSLMERVSRQGPQIGVCCGNAEWLQRQAMN